MSHTMSLLDVEPKAVESVEAAEHCADYVRDLRKESERIEAEHSDEIKFLYAEHKNAVAKQKAKLVPLESAMARCRLLLLRWCESNKPPSDVTLTPKFEAAITDPTLVPAEFCTPDLKLIEKFCNSMSGACEIPGVKITPKPTLTVKERKA